MVDEDTWVLPGAWRRSRVPRRGSVGIAPLTPAPDATAEVARFLADRGEAIRKQLDRADPDLREAGTAYLDGRPAPVGAGVVASGCCRSASATSRPSPAEKGSPGGVGSAAGRSWRG